MRKTLDNAKMIGNAIAIAADVHRHQVDMGGDPYFFHCFEVMKRSEKSYARLHPGDEGFMRDELLCAALLHDALEDIEPPTGRRRLMERIYADFPARVLQAVEALTKNDGEDYEHYIERVSRDWMARIIKLADLSHNLEAWRIPIHDITDRDYRRWGKYHKAFVRLMREESALSINSKVVHAGRS
jgi:(p)ppGpp synthase/HD superfamily hydrolase